MWNIEQHDVGRMHAHARDGLPDRPAPPDHGDPGRPAPRARRTPRRKSASSSTTKTRTVRRSGGTGVDATSLVVRSGSRGGRGPRQGEGRLGALPGGGARPHGAALTLDAARIESARPWRSSGTVFGRAAAAVADEDGDGARASPGSSTSAYMLISSTRRALAASPSPSRRRRRGRRCAGRAQRPRRRRCHGHREGILDLAGRGAQRGREAAVLRSSTASSGPAGR